MFKLVAFLFVIMSPNDPPVHAMTYNKSAFPTEEECRGFLETPAGKAASGSIAMMAHGHGLAVKFTCIESKDNSI
jgi:hypothetical protein